MRSLLESSQTVGQACGTSGLHHQAAFGVGRTLYFSTYTDSSNNHYFSSPVLATDLKACPLILFSMMGIESKTFRVLDNTSNH